MNLIGNGAKFRPLRTQKKIPDCIEVEECSQALSHVSGRVLWSVNFEIKVTGLTLYPLVST